MKKMFLSLLFVLTQQHSFGYEAIEISQVPPFYAAPCGTVEPNDPAYVYLVDNSIDTRAVYAQNPGPTGNDPTTYNGGGGLENLFWVKWGQHVFKISGFQDTSFHQVPLEVVTRLSLGTADLDLSQSGLTAAQIAELRANGAVNPAGERNLYFTGGWVRNQPWALPLQRPSETSPGVDCYGGYCFGRWILQDPNTNLDGSDTALYHPFPTNAVASRWVVKESIKTRPFWNQSLVVFPLTVDENGRGFGGIVFTGKDSTQVRLQKLAAMPDPLGTPTPANAIEEMLRWLKNGASYNSPGQTYCSNGFHCSPLDNPGDPNSSIKIFMLVERNPARDCRIPTKNPISPYSGSFTDYDGDGGDHPLFPDRNKD